jgi:hypothetical protein
VLEALTQWLLAGADGMHIRLWCSVRCGVSGALYFDPANALVSPIMRREADAVTSNKCGVSNERTCSRTIDRLFALKERTDVS